MKWIKRIGLVIGGLIIILAIVGGYGYYNLTKEPKDCLSLAKRAKKETESSCFSSVNDVHELADKCWDSRDRRNSKKVQEMEFISCMDKQFEESCGYSYRDWATRVSYAASRVRIYCGHLMDLRNTKWAWPY